MYKKATLIVEEVYKNNFYKIIINICFKHYNFLLSFQTTPFTSYFPLRLDNVYDMKVFFFLVVACFLIIILLYDTCFCYKLALSISLHLPLLLLIIFLHSMVCVLCCCCYCSLLFLWYLCMWVYEQYPSLFFAALRYTIYVMKVLSLHTLSVTAINAC